MLSMISYNREFSLETGMADADFFRFSISGPQDISVTVRPVGHTYMRGDCPHGECNPSNCIPVSLDTLTQSDLSLLVVDTLAEVIEWHERQLVPLGKALCDDGRCRFVHGDFFAMAADPNAGFDPAHPARRFHAVLLDVDHTPSKLLDGSHASLYTPGGLAALAAHLYPGGVFAMWSDDPPEAAFQSDLEQVFPKVEAHVVQFENPLLGKLSASTVYVAEKAM